MADEHIIFVSQHQVLFNKPRANDKDSDLKDSIWQSITDQMGHTNGEQR